MNEPLASYQARAIALTMAPLAAFALTLMLTGCGDKKSGGGGCSGKGGKSKKGEQK